VVIGVGDKLPNVPVKILATDGARDVSILDYCGDGRVVLFAVPGAFTPECSARHLPGFLDRHHAFLSHGIAKIGCIAVNDSFVMDAWAKANSVCDRITMLADGNGALTAAMGMTLDARPYGMGLRSQRYAMVIDRGVVAKLFVDEPGAFDVSAAEKVLAPL
jgi:peroxiredoxin